MHMVCLLTCMQCTLLQHGHNRPVFDSLVTTVCGCQGDGIWLPRTAFVGVQWVKQIHRDWFQAYTDWHFDLIEITASGAVKGFTEVFGLFHWQASNTGSQQVSSSSRHQR